MLFVKNYPKLQINSTIDQFLSDHVQTADQDLFQMVNVFNLLTIYHLMKSALN